MKNANRNDLTEIFSGSAIRAEMLRSILKDSEIESYLKDEYMGTIAPWLSAPGGGGSVKVLISSLDYTQAKKIVEKFNGS